MAEALVEPDKQGVVPRGTGRLYLLHQSRIPALERNSEGNVRKRVGSLTSNWIRCAGNLGLVDGTFADKMCASCP